MTDVVENPSVTTAKVDRPRKKKAKVLEVPPNPYTFRNALRHGDVFTWLSIVVWGLGNVVRGQVVKGVIWFLSEVLIVAFFVTQGFNSLAGLTRLQTGGKINQTLVDGAYVNVVSPASVDMYIYGFIAVGVLAAAVFLAWFYTRSAYRAQVLKSKSQAPTIVQDLRDLTDSKHENLLMSLPMLGILVFTVLPLIMMIGMAFTSFDRAHGSTWSWNGFHAFGEVLSNSGGLVNLNEFVGVLIWTLVWAFFATFLNYFVGMFFAMIINRPGVKIKGFWRAVFAMSIAVPQFVSLMTMNLLLSQQGVVNQILAAWGWIKPGLFNALPFMTDPTWARVTVIIINLWVGIPYMILQTTGILQNIPAELYEAARLDGASAWQIYRKITLPYMFFVMTPYLITSFVGNVNNFNVIYLLTQGGPAPLQGAATAPGATDLLITWLYKLSVTNQNYNIAAVIGIFTFIVLAVVSLITYRSSGSYRNEGGFN